MRSQGRASRCLLGVTQGINKALQLRPAYHSGGLPSSFSQRTPGTRGSACCASASSWNAPRPPPHPARPGRPSPASARSGHGSSCRPATRPSRGTSSPARAPAARRTAAGRGRGRGSAGPAAGGGGRGCGCGGGRDAAAARRAGGPSNATHAPKPSRRNQNDPSCETPGTRVRPNGNPLNRGVRFVLGEKPLVSLLRGEREPLRKARE